MTTEQDVRHRLLVDSITNALDAITLVDNVSEGMNPEDVKAAIREAVVNYGVAPTTVMAKAMLRYADVPKVTH